MIRFPAFAAAALALAGTAALAAPTGYYVATPAAQPTKTKLITRSTPWALRDGAFVAAARAPERDLILCQLVAKDAGALSSFSAGGQAFDADQLAKCNGSARGGATAVAR